MWQGAAGGEQGHSRVSSRRLWQHSVGMHCASKPYQWSKLVQHEAADEAASEAHHTTPHHCLAQYSSSTLHTEAKFNGAVH